MILVKTLHGKSMSDQELEIVERKGTGHPDQICDSVMEAISLALCREYTRKLRDRTTTSTRGYWQPARWRSISGRGTANPSHGTDHRRPCRIRHGGQRTASRRDCYRDRPQLVQETSALCRSGTAPALSRGLVAGVGRAGRDFRPPRRDQSCQRYLRRGRLLPA